MKKTNLLLLALTILSGTSFAQFSFQKTFGGASFDSGTDITATADGGYALTGFFGNLSTGYAEVFLIKTNENGDTSWTRTYGGHAGDDGGRSLAQTRDHGYVVCGFSASFNDQVYLIKTDSVGDTMWTKTYGDLDTQEGECVLQTNDDGFLISGESFGGTPGILLIKTDSQGDTLWVRTGLGSGPANRAYSIQQTVDSGFIICGYTTGAATGSSDVYLIRTNAAGDTLWTHTYGGIGNEQGRAVKQTSDGGFIVAAKSNSFGIGNDDIYLVKTDSSGNVEWSRIYGGPLNESAYSVEESDDGNFLVAGQSNSFNAGDNDMYLLQVDSMGILLWSKRYGGADEDAVRSMCKSNGGAYGLCGYSASFNSGNYAAYFVTTNINGNSACNENDPATTTDTAVTIIGSAFNLIPRIINVNSTATIMRRGCADATICRSDGVSEFADMNQVNIYPNPFRNNLMIHGTVDGGTINVYDVSGKIRIRQNSTGDKTELQTDNLASGFYLLNYLDGKKSLNFKVVKF